MPIDPDLFMTQTIDKPLEIERTLCPEGEYDFMVGDFDKSAFETFNFTYERGPNAGLPGSLTKFNCPCVTTDSKAIAAMGNEHDSVVVYRNMNLEFEEDEQTLKTGKNHNVELGQLRHAVGQRDDKTWSIAKLRNSGPFKGRVEHRTGKRKDGSPFKIAEITRVAPIR